MEPLAAIPALPDLSVSGLRKSMPSDETGNGKRFGDMLQDAIASVSDLQKASDVEIQKIMTGESEDLHTAVIALQKADLSFQMLMQVRNKVVSAYQEVMRMQV